MIALCGITTASRMVWTVTLVDTYWPGHRVESGLANWAFTRMVPVLGSTALSTNLSSPETGLLSSPVDACTPTLPARWAASTLPRLDSGRLNEMSIGSSWVMVVSEVVGCTRAPGWMSMAPTRPDIGARMVV